MSMLRSVPQQIGQTKLAYITDSEKKMLKRREAMKGFPGKKISAEGVPVLADSRADIIAHAKGLGIKNVPDPGVSKKVFKRFTDRLNKAKAEQRTGAAEIGADQISRKKFVLTGAQKKASSDFYKTAAGAAYAKQLGKKVGFGIRKPKKVRVSTGGTEEEEEVVITRPGPDPTIVRTVDGPGPAQDFDVTGVFTENKINSPILDDVVIYGPESEIVQERVKDLINTNSPLFKAATTKALQSMNASGLMNSSIAHEAVMSAILAVAIPMAQADAATFTAQRQLNQNYGNAFAMQQNKAFYDAFITKLEGRIQQTLRQLADRSANWRAILAERGRIATTPGMSTSAAETAFKAVTPTWF